MRILSCNHVPNHQLALGSSNVGSLRNGVCPCCRHDTKWWRNGDGVKTCLYCGAVWE